MSTPLYKSMKDKGSSFYAFPNASQDMNLAFNNDNYNLSFTKFVLLNIPEQELSSTSPIQDNGTMNFNKSTGADGDRFYNFQPGGITGQRIFSEELRSR